jgi:spermidine/putrescine transport system substrate-binding protein
MTKRRTSAEDNVPIARQATRRALLKSGLAAGALASCGPWVIAGAQSTSGSLSILNWDDELPSPVVPEFERTTGIKVISTPFAQYAEQIAKLQASKGVGFDLCQPTHDSATQLQTMGVLAPFEESRLALDAILPSLLAASRLNWTWDGKLHHVPHCWGAEAIAWRSDLTRIAAADLSYGTLWSEEYKGKVQGRPQSLLLGIGLWMDAAGRLNSNRMLDAYVSESEMKRIYDGVLQEAVARKPWIKQFWTAARDIKSGFLTNGVVIGQTWDEPAVSLSKAGNPISFQAPKEGAIGWIDGWSLTKAAKNVEQAYAFLKFLHSKETSAKIAEGSGYNPVVKGADELLSDRPRAIFKQAYPGDAIDRIWWRPVDPPWFADLVNGYAEKLKAAT